jgi:hypothetical protein
MDESEYSRLFGPDAGTGRFPSPNTLWNLLANAADGEGNRQRLLKAFETIPLELREKFRGRLQDHNSSNALGALWQLEFAALLQVSGVEEFVWIPEQEDSRYSRSVDFLLCERIHAEVTHLPEEGMSDSQRKLIRLISRGQVPPGNVSIQVLADPRPVVGTVARR